MVEYRKQDGRLLAKYVNKMVEYREQNGRWILPNKNKRR